ncbi:MAG: hypothetical protein AB1746_06625 [Candidatus Zixiibacteriota bacterium]
MNSVRYIILIACLALTILSACDRSTDSDCVEVYGVVYQSFNDFVDSIGGAIVKIGGYSTESDSLGRFRLSVPGNESYSVYCIHPLYDTFTSVTNVPDRDLHYDIALNGPVYNVFGTVSNPLDGPISDAAVRLGNILEISDDSGYFIFENIPQGRKQISCLCGQYFIYSGTAIVAGADLEFNVNLERTVVNLSGTVGHIFDGPLAGVVVGYDSVKVDTTDANGDYSFMDVSLGVHIIRSECEGYYSSTDTILIDSTDINYDFYLRRPMFEVLPVSEDATVAFYQHVKSGMTTETKFVDVNYGQLSDVTAAWHFEDNNMPSGELEYEFWDIRHRFIIKLPSLPENVTPNDVDSAFLNLNITEPFLYPYMPLNVRMVLSPWDEETVTWNTMPERSDVILSNLYPFDSMRVMLDISNLYKNPSLAPYGLFFSDLYEDNNNYCGTENFRFHSGESDSLSRRPNVGLFFTR